MTRRWPALVLIPLTMIAVVAFDQRADTERARRSAAAASEAPATLAQYLPVAAPADALSSTWYCAGGTAEPEGIADHAVVISNPNPSAASGTITAVPSTGEAVTETVDMKPFSRVRVTLTDLLSAPWAAALVEFREGRVVVEHEVTGKDDIDVAPCATSASPTWYFAAGVTTRNADERLVLFNPFPGPATVDISFATPQGRRTPSDLQGLQVPGNSVVTAVVTAQAQVDPQVSTSVVARSGRIVVDRIQTFDGGTATTTEEEEAAEPYRPKGITVALGVPRPATAWMFPVGLKDEGVHERFVVFNPSPDDEAEVDLAVSMVDPQVNGEIDPFSLSVPPGGYQVLELDEEARVATQVEHSTVVVATNGVPVVVERMLALGEPSVARGTSTSTGTPLVAPTWVFASGGNVPGKLSERISVQNPYPTRVTVKVEVMSGGKLGPVDGIGTLTLLPFEHRVIRFGDAVDDRQTSVVVSASRPIAAERLLFRIEDQGMSTAMGIPLDEGLALVPPGAAQGG